MDNKDAKQFFSIMTRVADIFDAELSERKQKSYFEILSEYTIDQVRDAFNRACRQCKFFPKPAEIIEFITGTGADVEAIAHKEAAKVLEAIRRIGGYNSVKFDDPTTAAVILYGFGGWEKLCNDRLESENKWFIIEFVKLYKSYKATRMEVRHSLGGIWENNNLKFPHEYLEAIASKSDAVLITDEILTPSEVRYLQ